MWRFTWPSFAPTSVFQLTYFLPYFGVGSSITPPPLGEKLNSDCRLDLIPAPSLVGEIRENFPILLPFV